MEHTKEDSSTEFRLSDRSSYVEWNGYVVGIAGSEAVVRVQNLVNLREQLRSVPLDGHWTDRVRIGTRVVIEDSINPEEDGVRTSSLARFVIDAVQAGMPVAEGTDDEFVDGLFARLAPSEHD